MKFCTTFLLIAITLLIPYKYSNSQITESKDELVKAIMDSDTRSLYKLNGKWEVSVDGSEFVTDQVPKIYYNTNEVRLRKIIHLDKQLIQNSVWHLYFLGVNDEIELFWNQQFLGKYVSDGAPLWITLPRKTLIKERNEVEIVVNCASTLAYQTRKNYLYFRKIVTGISRDFFLVRTPLVWINYYTLRTDFEGLSKAILKPKIVISSFEVENLAKNNTFQSPLTKQPFSLSVVLRNIETKQIVGEASVINFEQTSFRNNSLEPTIVVNSPVLWELENPYLYELEIKVLYNGVQIDNIRQTVGLSKWDTYKTRSGITWLINGKPFELKGVAFVEDFDYYNSGNDLAKFENDIKNIKSLGANTVKFLFNPPNPIFLTLASKYGLLVLSDLPVYYIPSSLLKKADLSVRFQTIMENTLKYTAMNPSFFAVGLGEGIDWSTSEVQEYFRKAYTKALQFPNIKKYATILPSQDPQNIEQIDFYIVKDDSRIKDNQQIISKLSRIRSSLEKPVVYYFGTIVDPNNHNGYNDIMSAEYQAFYINNRFSIKNQIGFSGAIFSSYTDYFTENPLGKSAINNPYVCYSGIINFNNQRISFSMLKALFTNEETPVVNPGQAEIEFPTVYLIVGAFAFLLWGILINQSRRFREHTYRSLFRTYNFFADIRDRRLISNLQTGIFGLVISIILAMYISSLLNYFKLNENFNILLNLLLPNDFLKEWILKLAWQPITAIIVLTILIFIKLNVLSLILKFASFFVRSKIFLNDTFKMVIWSGSPIFILLPVAIFISRILPISPLLSYIFNILFILFILLWLYRLIKSIWIVFDVKPSRVYLVSFVIIFIFVFSYITYLEYKVYLIEYLVTFIKQM